LHPRARQAAGASLSQFSSYLLNFAAARSGAAACAHHTGLQYFDFSPPERMLTVQSQLGQLVCCAGNVLVRLLRARQEALITVLLETENVQTTEIHGRRQGDARRLRVGIHKIEDSHTIPSNHPRDAALKFGTQLNSASSSSARMQSGPATPPGHGSPKEPVEGLRKPTTL
jgi:hypothetical protein